MSELINCSNSCNKSANAAAATAAAVLRRSHGSVVNWDAIVFFFSLFVYCVAVLLLVFAALPKSISVIAPADWWVKGVKDGWLDSVSLSSPFQRNGD